MKPLDMTPEQAEAAVKDLKAKGDSIFAEDLVLVRFVEGSGYDVDGASIILRDHGINFMTRLAKMLTGEYLMPKAEFYQMFDGKGFRVTIELAPKDKAAWEEGHMKRNGYLPQPYIEMLEEEMRISTPPEVQP